MYLIDNNNLHKSLQQLFSHKSFTQLNNNIYVAYSGGIDSSVLLHAVYNYIQNYKLNYTLQAIHINHGISHSADIWLKHCIQECQKLKIKLHYTKINITSLKHMGIEAAARKLRYEFIQKIAKNDIVLLAHHAKDQLETFLIQWQRGAGIDGLVSMPYITCKHNTTYIRPFLYLDKKEIILYAKQFNLMWVEDESNQQTKYKRNYIRHNIIPQLIENSAQNLNQNEIKSSYKAMLHSINMLQIQKKTLDKYLHQLLSNIIIRNNQLTLNTFLTNQNLIIDWNKFKSLYFQDKNEGILLLRYWINLHNIDIPSYKHINNLIEQIFPNHTNNILNKIENLLIPYQDKYIYIFNNYLAIYDSIYLLNAQSKLDNLSKALLLSSTQNLVNLKDFNFPHINYIINYKNINYLKLNLNGFTLQNCSLKLKVKFANRPHKSLKHIFQEQKIAPILRNFPVICYNNNVIYHPAFSTQLLTKIQQNLFEAEYLSIDFQTLL